MQNWIAECKGSQAKVKEILRLMIIRKIYQAVEKVTACAPPRVPVPCHSAITPSDSKKELPVNRLGMWVP